MVGFSVVDMQEDNIWALFLLPGFEGRGIGRKLQSLMLDWYFSGDKEHVWLGTSPGTRAAMFYSRSGWVKTGRHGESEIKFEMTREMWRSISSEK